MVQFSKALIAKYRSKYPVTADELRTGNQKYSGTYYHPVREDIANPGYFLCAEVWDVLKETRRGKVGLILGPSGGVRYVAPNRRLMVLDVD